MTELITTGQAAALLGVSTHTVSRWAKSGLIPSCRTPGGQLRFSADLVTGVRGRFLTPGQVAELFGVSPQRVGVWAREGKLPHVTTAGGHRRFPAALVEQIHAAGHLPLRRRRRDG